MNAFRKVVVTLCLLMLSQVISQAQDKSVTIHKENITIKEALDEIEKQSGYSIAYNQSQINLEKQVTLNITHASVGEALLKVLAGTPYTFKVNGYHIILFREKEGNGRDQNNNAVLTQSVRGKVTDAATGLPLQYASVGMLNQAGGTVTDSIGQFKLVGILVGRHDVQVSLIGYTPMIVREVLVTSAKEVYLEIALKENHQLLDEVVVHPEINKEGTLNRMAITGGRMLSVEEASRYAGGMDDPARLITSFAGVAGSYATNAVSIHGNSPQANQWRLEGVEIPNPTHYADMVGLGGGIFSALSSQVMGNSDFYAGAFPAEYNNSTSGIFDMFMRSGNNQRYQHTFQAGLLGIDAASEGPLGKSNSSYIFNYRYSTTGVVTGTDLRYQDLSFKLNFPTRKAGVFSIWGLGLLDKINAAPLDSSSWETYADREDVNTYLYRTAGGFSHKFTFKTGTSIKTSIAATYSGIKQDVDQINIPDIRTNVVDITNNNWDLVYNTSLNKKISNRHINQTGITITDLRYNLDYNVSPDFGLDKSAQNIAHGKGHTLDIAPFTNSLINIGKNVIINVGVNAHFFALSNSASIEPRLGVKWKTDARNSLAFAYGLHSRREKTDYYFIEINNEKVNEKLKLAKAHHLIVTYDSRLSENLHLKIEPYFQYLFDVPVEKGSSFSIINHDDYYLERALVNEGNGRNYGVDLTLEHYLTHGYYYMFTASVFKSEYKAGDNVWRNTRFDRNYIINALGGREWIMGRNRNRILGANCRLTFQGGDRYTPLDEDASLSRKDIVWDESKAYSLQYKSALNADISINYKINRKKVAHEIALKVLNTGTYTGQHGYLFNERTGVIEKQDVAGFLPNLSYKIEF
jgi:hypothetical protein